MFFLFWTARAVTVTLSIFCSIKHVLPDFIRLRKFFKKSTKNGLLSCHSCNTCVIRTRCSTHHRFRLINVLHRFFQGWTQPWLDQSMNMRSISMLWLHMNIGWSGLNNMLFIHYLSIRNNIYGAIHFRFLLLIWFSSAVLEISGFPHSLRYVLYELSGGVAKFVFNWFISLKKMHDLINCQLFIKLPTPLQFLYEP